LKYTIENANIFLRYVTTIVTFGFDAPRTTFIATPTLKDRGQATGAGGHKDLFAFQEG
jgi:hypothetical protein